MTKTFKVLDHGYLKIVEGWGSDRRIVEAARMSTGKGFLRWNKGKCPQCSGTGGKTLVSRESGDCLACEGKGVVRGDKALLKYLYDNWHHTPFEMAGFIIEVQAPIFVFREWHRHRTQSYNEMSARYTPLPDLNYIPTVERLMLNSRTNKQAGVIKGAQDLTEPWAMLFQASLQDIYQKQEDLYQWALKAGVPKELARIHLPVGRYSRMRASANLRNWLSFLTLRTDPAAQFEIRQFANAVGDIVAAKFPRTWELYLAKKSTKG